MKDGEERLEAVLAAVRAQGDVELIVIDSGSRDRSREIARAAGADLIEIPPEEFGHGRTRNLGAERSSGDLICFLTQDAVPVEGWLDAYRDAFALDERVGRCLRAPPPPPGHEPDDRPRADRVLPRLRARRPARAPAGRRPDVPVERERLLRPRLLGRAALSGCRVLGGPGLRAGDARRRLGEGLPSRRGRPARARLRAARVRPALLRRVPRTAARPPGTWRRCSRSRPRASWCATRAG